MQKNKLIFDPINVLRYVQKNFIAGKACMKKHQITDNMDEYVKAEFERYVSYISKMDGVLRIYLFGSYASGTPTENSDIDLMVVVHDGVDSLKIMQDVSRGLMNRQVSLDVLVDNLSDFTELSQPERITLQREIKNKGVLVYAQ